MLLPAETSPASVSDVPASAPVLSGRLAVLRSGRHLGQVAQSLRELEPAITMTNRTGLQENALARIGQRSELQSLDLIIQELAGLSDILMGLALLLPDVPDLSIDALVERPRLQSLSTALRDQVPLPVSSDVVIF